MKYSELINFNPIEDVIVLTSANDKKKAREYVKSYVMSDTMASNLKTLVIDQLQMDNVVNNKGVLIIGNYGTGKSHLMSVISAVANDAENLQYLGNKKFARDMKCIAGKFEILRSEFTGITMPFRQFILELIMDDFGKRGIKYKLPDLDKVKDNKKLVKDMMMAFESKYPDKGYLLVVDELLNYLLSRNAQELVMDLEFLRVLGEMSSKSKLRVIFGMQEKLINNPKFGFVADTLGHVRDRLTEMVIAKEDTSYVVSERILKKTPEQKAKIRKHLEKFSELYSGMVNRMDEFVNMFPIHPAYIDVFNKVYLIENRHVLKNISVTIKEIFNETLPDDEPGVISFDDYWRMIKKTPMLATDPAVKLVLDASAKLENIIGHGFSKAVYKPLAKQIIYALSVYRLTTNDLSEKSGLTAENLKDDLCLFVETPEESSDMLLGVVRATLKEIMTTVSGQFIVYNDANNQYYIDVNKTVDYDEKIKQRAGLIYDDELNHSFYGVVYSCLEWDAKQYVTNFEIYERDLNWDSHNIYREGYLFMGLPGERSTAQPERDFYIHIMPPYGNKGAEVKNLPDEVYLYFKSNADFKNDLTLYAAANNLAQMSEGNDRTAYSGKAMDIRKKLIKYLSDNKNTCFNVLYKKEKRQIIEVLKDRYDRNLDFKDTIDLVASICLDDYFNSKYPDYPIMKTKVTRKNVADTVKSAFEYFAGRKTSVGRSMLESFGILDGDKIRPEGSKYAAYYIDKVKKLPQKGVINYSDIFEEKADIPEDKEFHIGCAFTPIIFLSIIYGGYATMTLKNNTVITAATLDQIPKINVADLYIFKYLSKPADIPLAELKQLFDAIGLNKALLDNPNDRDTGIGKLLETAQNFCNSAIVAKKKLQEGFKMWGEPLVNEHTANKMQEACDAVANEFANYGTKFNTYAKLRNFILTSKQIEELKAQIDLINVIGEYVTFKSAAGDIVSYMSDVELIDMDHEFKAELEDGKTYFREIRDDIQKDMNGDAAAKKVIDRLNLLKDKYIQKYIKEHKRNRLDITGAKRKGNIQSGADFENLRKLRNIEILSGAKLTAIEEDMADLKVCYELDSTELETDHICRHCHYSLNDKVRNATDQLNSIEDRIGELLTEWTKTLLDTVNDPIVAAQKKYLTASQKKAIDVFAKSEELPKHVDDNFIQSIGALLRGFEPVVIDTDDIILKLDELGPCDVATFKNKLNAIVDSYVKGKDMAKLRIIVKRKESGE